MKSQIFFKKTKKALSFLLYFTILFFTYFFPKGVLALSPDSISPNSYNSTFSLLFLIKRAEQNSPGIKSMLYQLKARNYQLWQTISQYFPHVNILGSWGKEKYHSYYGRCISQKIYSYSISLVQPLFHPEVFAQYKQIRLYKEIDKLRLSQQKQSLRLDILQNILKLAYLKRKEMFYNQLILLKKKNLEEAKKLLEKKFLTLTDYFLLTQKLQDDLIAISDVKKELKNTAFYLDLFVFNQTFPSVSFFNITLSPSFKLIPPLSLTLPSILFLNSSEIYSESYLFQNFDLRISQKYIDVYKEEEKRRFYAWAPKADFRVSYEYNYEEERPQPEKDFKVEVTFNFPIFSGGYNWASISEAKALELSQLEKFNQVKQEVYLKWQTSCLQIRESLKKYILLLKKKEKALKLLLLVKKGFSRGVFTRMDVNNQEIELIKIKLALLDEVHNHPHNHTNPPHTTPQLKYPVIKKLNNIFTTHF